MKELLKTHFTTEGYQDVRYERLKIVNIEYLGPKLREISVSKKEGGHARGFYRGGWGYFSFTNPDDISLAVNTALEQAKLISNYPHQVFELAKAPVVNDHIYLEPALDPRKIGLEEKRELLNKYNQIALSLEGVVSTQAGYYEQWSHKYFANNEGTFIDHEELICGIRLIIFARRDRNTQKVNIAFGGTTDFAMLLNNEEAVLEGSQKAVDLLTARPVNAGNYVAIMDPDAASVFIHEAFGHLSEADSVVDSEQLKETMCFNRVFGRAILNVIDDGSIPGHPGSMFYDDEGVKAEKTYLIKNGVLVGRLHSRETAGRMGEVLSGNCRAKDFSFSPVVRMSNIYIDKGTSTFAEMLASIKDGIYLVGAAGGQTSGNTFTFATQYGYQIKDGKLAEMVRDIVVNCNLFETLANISAVGEDLRFTRIGGCGKAGQILIMSGKGSPHIKIDNITIGGK